MTKESHNEEPHPTDSHHDQSHNSHSHKSYYARDGIKCPNPPNPPRWLQLLPGRTRSLQDPPQDSNVQMCRYLYSHETMFGQINFLPSIL